MVSGPSSAPQISSLRADVDMRRHACWWRVREPATLTREPRCGMTGPATTLTATRTTSWPPDGIWHLTRTASPAAHAVGDVRHCRIEGVAPGRIYAQKCIIFHDSASVLTSQRQLLRSLFTYAYSRIADYECQLDWCASARSWMQISCYALVLAAARAAGIHAVPLGCGSVRVCSAPWFGRDGGIGGRELRCDRRGEQCAV